MAIFLFFIGFPAQNSYKYFLPVVKMFPCPLLVSFFFFSWRFRSISCQLLLCFFSTSFLSFLFAEKPDGFDPENLWHSSGYTTYRKDHNTPYTMVLIIGITLDMCARLLCWTCVPVQLTIPIGGFPLPTNRTSLLETHGSGTPPFGDDFHSTARTLTVHAP